MNEKPPLPIPSEAKRIHSRIVDHLKDLAQGDFDSCSGQAFLQDWSKVLGLFDSYLSTLIDHETTGAVCRKGCSFCCYHWVEDVYSFEIEIIASHLRTELADFVDPIVECLHKDVQQIKLLEQITKEKLSATEGLEDEEDFDPHNVLLSSFYQLQTPCPLLSPEGTCLVYEKRPLTCRSYVNLIDPLLCTPEKINQGEIGTYMIDLEAEAIPYLEALHTKFERSRDHTGFRALLLQYLTD